ncbi:MAG: nuclear transport factor 2 family protein [Xanthobacteraceae bacterium]|nr:nuclear transport factor 2 family protein [Xanthobacteraceae bacterium]MBY0613011.1 nuclear transport factor 2 family protein [Beijerinckiaceae bacterium]
MSITIDSISERLQSLLDREAIGQAIVSYGLSFDRRDWALQRALFLDEIEMDFSASIGAGLTTMKADDWVAGVRPFFEALPATQHIAYPLKMEITGDEAYVVSLLHAQHYLPNKMGEPVQRMVGWYENWLVRSVESWKFRKMVQHIDWNEGNWWIFEKAAGTAK